MENLVLEGEHTGAVLEEVSGSWVSHLELIEGYREMRSWVVVQELQLGAKPISWLDLE